MRTFLSKEYFPFGTQYYRAPSPAPGDWERDLAAIAAVGMNTVKFWIQWRWNNPREGEYRFDDIDHLMEIAQSNSLRVMLNTIVDVAPGWIYRKYPDASMLTLDGRRVGPQTQPHRQIGGLGLCFNHPHATTHMMDFLRTSIRRYKDHPALEIWNVASEPELTSSMAELRLYADDARQMRDMLCYCNHCTTRFRQWLKTKYGEIGLLNHRWNRNYGAFDEVEIPLTRNTFNDMIDWRMFFVDTLGRNVRERFEVARTEDGGKHPLMCHHVFIQGFPVTSTANDPWNVGNLGQLHGMTQMDDPMMCDVLRSCARGKPVISAEMLMLFGYTLELPHPVAINDVKRFIFTGLAANLKGFIFWQYRPEILGREAPAWGLTFLDGSPTPWLEAYGAVGSVLQKNAGFLLDAAPPPAEVALLFHPENQIFSWAATGSEKTATGSLLGTHAALYQHNFRIDFVHPSDFEHGVPGGYKVLVIPFPYLLGEKVGTSLGRWVKDGGVLLCEAYCGGWDFENGCHQTTVPGHGLHTVFKALQRRVAPAPSDDGTEMTLARDVGTMRQGTTVRGALVEETLSVEGAEVLARFSSGEPAITMTRYGEGTAILIGSYVGLQFSKTGHRDSGDLLASLIDDVTTIRRPAVDGNGRVRVDALHGPDGHVMVIVRNLEKSGVRATLHVPGIPPNMVLREQFSGEIARHLASSEGITMPVELGPSEVQVYRNVPDA